MKITIVILIILLVSLLLSQIKVLVTYNRHNLDDRLEITISYLKVLKHTFHLSILDISKTDKNYGFKIKSSLKKEQEGFIDFKTIINKIKQFRLYYRLYTKTMDKIFKSLRRGTIAKDINIKVELGMIDNILTGIAVGSAYSLIWTLFGMASGYVKIKKYKLTVNPNFKDLLLIIQISCIFTIRLGNIIYVGFCILFLFIFSYLNQNNLFYNVGKYFSYISKKVH